MIAIKKMLRKQKNRTSLYLDYTFEGKRIQENTKLFYLPGKDNIAKAHNKNVDILFEKKKAEKINQLFEGSNNYIPAIRRRADFFEYIEKYQLEHPTTDRKLRSCVKHLKAYTRSSLIFSEINELFLLDFKFYLQKHVKGETPRGYFKALGRVLSKARKEKYLLENPASDIRVSSKPVRIKEVLCLEEINTLKDIPCPNKMIKRAFLFACFTGIRFCDVKKLTWSNLYTQEYPMLEFTQSKTKKLTILPLNESAVKQLSVRGADHELIFQLPTANGTNKILKAWIKNSGIDKNITFHCARHSFGTNINRLTNDVYTASQLLGHSSVVMTQRYVRTIPENLVNLVKTLDN